MVSDGSLTAIEGLLGARDLHVGRGFMGHVSSMGTGEGVGVGDFGDKHSRILSILCLIN